MICIYSNVLVFYYNLCRSVSHAGLRIFPESFKHNNSMVSVFLNFSDVLPTTDDRNWENFFMTESSSPSAFKLNSHEFEKRCGIVPFFVIIDVSQGLRYIIQELSCTFALIGPSISKGIFVILPHIV